MCLCLHAELRELIEFCACVVRLFEQGLDVATLLRHLRAHCCGFLSRGVAVFMRIAHLL